MINHELTKYFRLFLILIISLASCTKPVKKDGKEVALSKDEKLIQRIYTQFIVERSLSADSVQSTVSRLDSLKTDKTEILAKANLIKGTFYYKKAKFQLSKEYFENALQQLDSVSLNGDFALVGLGNCYKNLGNFPKALQYFQQSISNNEGRKDTLRLAGVYATLAQLYQEKEDFGNAKENINKVFELLINNDSSQPYLITLHTLANVEAQSGNFKTAIEIDNKGIAITDKINNAIIKTSFQDNLARCYLYYYKDYEKAKFYFNENLKIDKQLNNPSWIADTYINLSEVYTAEGNFISAEKSLQDAIKIFTESKQLNNSLKGYQALSALYQKQGNLQKALEAKELYLQQYKKSLNEKSEQSFAEYNILYETHKKEKELANAKLQIAETKLASRQKNIGIILLISALIIGFIVFRSWQAKANQTKKRLVLENQLLQEKTFSQIQQQRLEISRDLHDSLGAQLTFINSILDGLKSTSSTLDEKINGKINTLANFSENSITELRNTLWVLNAKEINLSDLRIKILNYINKASEAAEQIQFHYHFEVTQDFLLSSRQAINLFRAIQEIINNAVKYSFAKNISISIHQQQRLLKINITDDGIGFDFEKLKTKSYGLGIIQNRTEEINGSLLVETAANKGSAFVIETPL